MPKSDYRVELKRSAQFRPMRCLLYQQKRTTRTAQTADGEGTSAQPVDQGQADKREDEVDERHERRPPNRRLVTSYTRHLDDRCAVIPARIGSPSSVDTVQLSYSGLQGNVQKMPI